MPIAVAKHGFWWVPLPVPVVVNPTTIANGAPNTAYSQTFTATGGDGGPYTWSVLSGTLPPGTNLDPNSGILSGTVTGPDATDYTFEIKANDGSGNSGSRQYTLHVEFDRSRFPFVKNDVLIVYDLNSVHPGQYDFDVNPANLAANISARETALGFTPHTVSSYASLPADLSIYAHIWDVGYDTLIPAPIGSRYKTYLQGSGIENNSGAMFFLGENGAFIQRDTSIENFIETDLGGGSITINDGHYVGLAVIQPEFLLANPNSIVDFNDVANFTSTGTGTPMVITNGAAGMAGQQGAPGLNVAVVWKTGSLSQATNASVCSILDVNWLDNVYINSIQPNLIDNISVVMNKK